MNSKCEFLIINLSYQGARVKNKNALLKLLTINSTKILLNNANK